jgi:hypothetical protein
MGMTMQNQRVDGKILDLSDVQHKTQLEYRILDTKSNKDSEDSSAFNSYNINNQAMH